MPWRGPSYEGEFPSLGWSLLDLAFEHLRVPSGPKAGERFELTDEQAAFVVRLYRVDESGRRVVRRGAMRRPKGWGKSPLLAAIALGELVGDIVFDGWDAAGEPVGRPHRSPWVQIAACSEDQTDNTYVALLDMLRESTAVDEFGLEPMQGRVQFKDRQGRLEPVTAAAGSREGQPVTFAVLDETHLWTPTNGGVKLAQTIRRNVAKMDGASVETTNAYRPGEGSVAESTDDAFHKGTVGLLYDSIEAPWVEDLTDGPVLREALTVAYGASASFVDLDRLVAECNDPSVTPSEARRFYLNQVVPGEERFCDVGAWDALAVDRQIVPGSSVVVGFDGSATDDSTVLYAWTVEEVPHGGIVAAWERPEGVRDWQVPRDEVSAAVHMMFDTFDVLELVADPWGWGPELESWLARYGGDRVVANDPAKIARFGPACDTFREMLKAEQFTHDGDRLVRRHVANAVGANRSGRWVPVKEKHTMKIDALVAAILGLGRAVYHQANRKPVATWFGGWA